jgi:hypothetical protein
MSVSPVAVRRTRSAVSRRVLGAGALAGVLTLLAAVGPTVAAGASVGTGKVVPTRPVERVLVVSIPHVGWADLVRADAPNLQRLLDRSAIAAMTARTGGGGPVAGYATLGAGKRSTGSDLPTDGLGFGVDEYFGTVPAADAFTTRTGVVAERGVVHLGIVGLRTVNAAEPGGSSLGALGGALTDAGFTTAVIGNSDGSVPGDLLDRYRRYLVAGLMTGRGTVAGGTVGPELLEVAPSAPFGVRLDRTAVLDAFRTEWTDGAVVMVEGSDLVRAVAARFDTRPGPATDQFDAALRRTDALVGALLAEVDPRRDAVVVVSPYPSRDTRSLTVVGVRAPGVEPGLMTSASTRRDGFVILADVAPTILGLVDLPRPDSMNGRPFATAPARGSADARIDWLVDETDAALFRDTVLTPMTIVAIALAALVVLAAVVATETGRRRWRTAARVGASWLLGLVPAIYLARLVPFHDLATGWYFLAVAGGGLVLATSYEVVGAGRRLRATALGLGVLVVLLVVDLATGADLQLSTVFGYTPSVGVRFAGVGNVAYAFLGASTIFLAAFLVHRIGGRRGIAAAGALMAVALVVDAAPMFGGDVGGALSLTVAYLVTLLLLAGTRIRVRTVVGLAAAAVGVLVVAATVDLLRPTEDRTHLGRLVTNARARGVTEITDVLIRKLLRNLDTWTTSAWRSMLVIGLLFVIYLWWRARPRVRNLIGMVPELRPALVGFTVLSVVGYALNDSGVAIPAVTLYVFVAVMVGLLTRAPDQPPTAASSTDSVRAATASH